MFELTFVCGLSALIFCSSRALRPGNPFQVYFAVWSLVLFLYGISRASWVEVGPHVWAFLLFSHLIWLAGIGAFWRRLKTMPPTLPAYSLRIRGRPLLACQLICLVGLPFAYASAVSASGGSTLLDQGAYSQLRHEQSEGSLGLGWSAYLILLSFIVASLTALLGKRGEVGLVRISVAVLVAAGYAFISTGRTFILLLVVMLIAPLYFGGYVKRNALVVSAFVLVSSFVLSAALTGKGASFEAGLLENLETFSHSLRAYTVAPILAFAQLSEEGLQSAGGAHTFRFFFRLWQELGFSGGAVEQLVREYSYVPDATNVYTVFDPYFRDFGYFALMFSLGAMLLHVGLYLRAVKGGIFVVLYCVSIYPLSMQFFQDQYFSLFSTWVQLVIWLGLLVGPEVKIRSSHV